MAESGTLHDAFLDELRDGYDAEKQLIKALPKLAKAASPRSCARPSRTTSRKRGARSSASSRCSSCLDEKVRGKHCDGIAGIIEEGKSVMEEDFDDATMDACLIAGGQRAEHYEMAAYGTLVAWARGLGHTEAADLQQTLEPRRKRPTRSCRSSPRVASIRKPACRPTPLTAGRQRRRPPAKRRASNGACPVAPVESARPGPLCRFCRP